MLDLSTRDYREDKLDSKFKAKFNTVTIDPILPETNLNTLENRYISPLIP